MGKEELLARVRAAVARGAKAADAGPAAPPHLPGYAPANAPEEELVGAFCAELENSRVGFSLAGSVGEISDLLDGLLPSGEGVSVALSDAVSELLPGFEGRLLRRGLRVVTPARAGEAGGGVTAGVAADARGDACDDDYRRALFECEAGVTTADYGVAEAGTLALVSGGERHRLISLLPPIHVCLLATDRLLPVMGCLLERVRGGRAGGRPSPTP